MVGKFLYNLFDCIESSFESLESGGGSVGNGANRLPYLALNSLYHLRFVPGKTQEGLYMRHQYGKTSMGKLLASKDFDLLSDTSFQSSFVLRRHISEMTMLVSSGISMRLKRSTPLADPKCCEEALTHRIKAKIKKHKTQRELCHRIF